MAVRRCDLRWATLLGQIGAAAGNTLIQRPEGLLRVGRDLLRASRPALGAAGV